MPLSRVSPVLCSTRGIKDGKENSSISRRRESKILEKQPAFRSGSQIPRSSPLDESLRTVNSAQIPLSKQSPSHTTTAPGTSYSRDREIMRHNSNIPHQLQASSKARIGHVLGSTTIPGRKGSQALKSQKLPSEDHVASFSRLLLEDITAAGPRIQSGSVANPEYEELFGRSPESSPAVLNDVCDTSGSISMRSMSSESMPSLVADDGLADSLTSEALSAGSLSQRRLSPSFSHRSLSFSQDCSDSHPLQDSTVSCPDPLETEDCLISEDVDPPEQLQKSFFSHRRRPSFRSNLTASIRAIKSAAQTVSSLASSSHAIDADDFITRSIFSFAPQLTDDKRPLPSNEPPSPALRRYLNPRSTLPEVSSPAELCSFSETPRSPHPGTGDSQEGHTLSPRSSGTAIQLQICIPSRQVSANASSPPMWIKSESSVAHHGSSTPPSQSLPHCQPSSAPSSSPSASPSQPPPTSLPSSFRMREPRENPAFLRILVAEMNMRRQGKFSDDMCSHAHVWLPPRQTSDVSTSVAAAASGAVTASSSHPIAFSSFSSSSSSPLSR